MSFELCIAGVPVEIHLLALSLSLSHTHTQKFIAVFDLKSCWNAEVFRRYGVE
jgi:hypothetical protein